MRKLTSLIVAVLLAVPLAACEQQPTQLSEQTQDGSANSANQSSSSGEVVTGTAVLRAVGTFAAEQHGFQRGERIGTIQVTDDGEAMVTSADGEASGLKASHLYGSLFYDKLSSEQGSPKSGESAINASACEPGADEDHPLFITLRQMVISADGTFPGLIGSWDVTTDPATLDGETLQYVPLKKIGTVSIRDFTLAGEVDAPDEFVVACGVVTRDPAN